MKEKPKGNIMMNLQTQLQDNNAEKIARKLIKSNDIYVQIMTSLEYNRELAYDVGFSRGIQIDKLDMFVDNYLKSFSKKNQEFVEFSENYVKIIVDYENITDDAILHAERLLSEYLIE